MSQSTERAARIGHFDLADPPQGRLHEADFERCRRDSGDQTPAVFYAGV